VNSGLELISGEWIPDLTRFALNFVQDTEVNWMMEGSVKRVMEGIPQTIRRETWTVIIFNCFGHRKLSFLDPVH